MSAYVFENNLMEGGKFYENVEIFNDHHGRAPCNYLFEFEY